MSATANSMRVAAVLPALNESASIDAVVRGIGPFAQVIVVDDGSTDGTGEIATAAGGLVARHERNLGYDRALETGLRFATQKGFEFAVTLDADGQHDPRTIIPFIEALEAGADLVVGARDRHQRFAESMFAWVGSTLWGIRDPLCGMKGYRLSVLQRAGSFDTYTSIGTEFTLRAARSGCRIAQVAVPTRDRTGASRFGSGLRANWRILRALFIGLATARRFET